jgi:hypothetical protein
MSTDEDAAARQTTVERSQRADPQVIITAAGTDAALRVAALRRRSLAVGATYC